MIFWRSKNHVKKIAAQRLCGGKRESAWYNTEWYSIWNIQKSLILPLLYFKANRTDSFGRSLVLDSLVLKRRISSWITNRVHRTYQGLHIELPCVILWRENESRGKLDRFLSVYGRETNPLYRELTFISRLHPANGKPTAGRRAIATPT